MKRFILLLFIGPLAAVAFALSAYALDPPHDSSNAVTCTTGPGQIGCHIPHNALGGAITIASGNGNLCMSCHKTGGDASNLPFDASDQALPRWGLPAGVSPTGTSHRWDSGVSGHADVVGTPSGTGTVESGGSYSGTSFKTYTITIASDGEATTTPFATFDWTDTLGGGATGVTAGTDVLLDEGVTVTFTDGAAPGSCNDSFCSGDQYRVYVRPDLRLPTNATMAARIDSNNKIMCSTCHNQHSQLETPYDPSAPAYGGPGTGAGRHFQRIDNSTQQMCEDCHNAKVGVGSHLSLSGTGQPFEDKCFTCHTVHFAPNPDGSLTKLDGENTCYTCHDSDGPATTNIAALFTGGVCTGSGNAGEVCTVDADCPSPTPGACSVTNFQVLGNMNQRHDVSAADQTFSGGALECTNCHNPHTLTSTNKLINPDNWSDGTTNFVAGQPFTKVYSTSNTYFFSGTDEPYQVGTDQDPVNPAALFEWTVGEAVKQTGLGGDTATSGGPYSAAGDEGSQIIYTVTVDAGAATITTTTATVPPGGSSDNDNDTVVFGTPIAIGARGVTIQFKDDNVGDAVCVTAGGCDDIAASGGTYGGALNGTYTVTVNTTDRPRNVNITCTGLDCGSSTVVCQPSGSGGPQCAYDTAFAVGSSGVTITISDFGASNMVQGDSWTIAVDPDVGLEPGEQWKITVTEPVGDVYSEPDYVAFCLTCHDNDPQTPGGSQPAGVTMSSLTDIASAWFGNDSMGARPGTTGTGIGNGYLKQPWHVQPSSCSEAGGWTGCEDPTNVYAALNCTVCHDQHGSGNIFHLRTKITVAGYELYVGGDDPNSQFGSTSAFAATDRYLSTTYTLPCQGGNGEPDCALNPSGAQEDLHYGAWCTFCHEMAGSHPSKGETGSAGGCASSHVHNGANF